MVAKNMEKFSLVVLHFLHWEDRVVDFSGKNETTEGRLWATHFFWRYHVMESWVLMSTFPGCRGTSG
jgi:hypothetical protein